MSETLFTVERKIRHCKTCRYKCKREEPIVGCESIMVPVPPLKVSGKTYVSCCIKRIWFDKDHKPVEIWDSTKIKPGMTEEEFEKMMIEELRKARMEAERHE